MSKVIPFGPQQREVWLGAAPLAITSGTEATLVLSATENMWIDGSRLCFVNAPTTTVALTGIQQRWDFTPYTRLTAAIYKNAVFFLRGTNPDAPASAFSPLRNPKVRYPGFGPLYLEATETLELTFLFDLLNTAAADVIGTMSLCVPCVPDRIAGQGIIQKAVGGQVWDESLGVEYIGGPDTAFPVAPGTALDTPFVDAGLVDIGGMLLNSNSDAIITAPTELLNYTSRISSILIPGGGERLILTGEVPFLCHSDFGRMTRWARLGQWGGNRGQTVNVTAENTLTGSAGRASVGYPYLPRGTRHPALDSCACK